jgi:hypothetical protein
MPFDTKSTASTKGTTITSYPSLEYDAVGKYDDTVLKLLDPVMVDARKYGIKVRSRTMCFLFYADERPSIAFDQHAQLERSFGRRHLLQGLSAPTMSPF